MNVMQSTVVAPAIATLPSHAWTCSTESWNLCPLSNKQSYNDSWFGRTITAKCCRIKESILQVGFPKQSKLYIYLCPLIFFLWHQRSGDLLLFQRCCSWIDVSIWKLWGDGYFLTPPPPPTSRSATLAIHLSNFRGKKLKMPSLAVHTKQVSSNILDAAKAGSSLIMAI